MEMESHPITLS